VKVIGPVVAGRLEGIVHELPRRVSARLEQDTRVSALVRMHLDAKRLRERGQELVSASSWPRDMQDDGSEWHRSRS
jgi:hypothetical protein